MKFDKNRVFTALNADELKVGSKVVTADSIDDLKNSVENNLSNSIKVITEILEDRFQARFRTKENDWYLVYLIEEPDEPEYRPFENGKEAMLYLKDKWLISKTPEDKSYCLVTGFYENTVEVDGRYPSFKELFNEFEVYNIIGKNEPCGVKVNKDENETN